MARFKNIKINLRSILISIALLSFFNLACFSQSGTTIPDSSKISLKSSETGEKNQNQVQAKTQAQNRNQGNAQKAANENAVKQVKSAKPDMSKAKGARPNIVRPTGSAVPKGAGKPGGIKRMGGR